MAPPLTQNFCALDLELNQPSNKIIQVGISIGNSQQSEDEYILQKWYLNPNEPIVAEIEQLTGISNSDIEEKAVSHEVVALELGALLLQHQCFINPVTWGGGDSSKLLAEFYALNIQFPHFGRRWVDTKTIHAGLSLATGKNPAGGLRPVMGRYKLPFIGQPHRADVDAFNTLRLFFLLLSRLRAMESMVSLAKSV